MWPMPSSSWPQTKPSTLPASACTLPEESSCLLSNDGHDTKEMKTMAEAGIVDAVPTAIGKKNGALSQIHPVDLLTPILQQLVQRNGIDPDEVDDVVTGCVTMTGEQGGNIGRMAVLAAGFPVEVPAVSLNRMCGSSQQAIHFAAQ